jgi:3-phenylpropionate/trans-cinnamate dioxygenase ferredoxin reductase subunit
MHLSRVVQRIFPNKKRKTCRCRQRGGFHLQKLLLFTAGRPRDLAFDDDEIIYFRTLSDYQRLRELTATSRRFAVIGGGCIGSEIAAGQAMIGKEVVMMFPDQNVGERVFPGDLSQYICSFYKQKGVELLAGERIVALERAWTSVPLEDGYKARNRRRWRGGGNRSGAQYRTCPVSGLKTDNGIVVDEFLRTRQLDIYAAGDVAAFHSLVLGKRIRVEHEDNANSMGRLAGRNMAGMNERYNHLPSFYSGMFELGYEPGCGFMPTNRILAFFDIL